jgi:hypothetical protein
VLVDEFFFRADSNAEADERLLWRADAAVIQAAQSNIANASPQECDPAVSAIPVGCDTLERLVELRRLHQTRRAASSVRSRGESKTQESQDGRPTETSAAAKRQKLCAQMADVIRRAGTGLERCARWRAAPGTMDPSEVSELKGNSANAEAVAKDQVKAVSDCIFLLHGLPTSPHLVRTGPRVTAYNFHPPHKLCETPSGRTGRFRS